MGRLFQELIEYSKSDVYPYHMPGHKRNAIGDLPKEIADLDITEIDGFDNLHDAQEILAQLQQKAAKVFGAGETHFLVNGSTCGILSAISAVLEPGEHLLMTRNCHHSAYHGAYLRQLKVSYLYPDYEDGYDFCKAITPAQVQKALEEDSSIKAVLIVSPTYEGQIADVETIAQIVHEKGIPLIVDEAHGAHLGFHPAFAKNSAQAGADLVIQSVHKTLAACTQTALLHCQGDLVDRERLSRFLRIYQSSSPSYVLMASIDNAVEVMETQGAQLLDRMAGSWQKMLQDLSSCKMLSVYGCDNKPAEKTKIPVHDIGKLVISVKNTRLSGTQLGQLLLNKYQLQMEMVCDTYVLAMFTLGDTREGYDRLTEALLEIEKQLCENTDPMAQNIEDESLSRYLYPSQAELPLWKAWDMPGEIVDICEAQGRIAGDFVKLYPPGIPILVPGEQITEKTLSVIRHHLDRKMHVQGISGNSITVLCQES